MSQDLKSLMAGIVSLCPESREKYIREVSRWLLYRDPEVNTWYSDSQKALLQEIYELRKEIQQLKQ